MSLRGAETSDKNAGGKPAERRKSRARVTFETAVTASDASGASAFEAESVDVSPEGMRLRAAYVPEVGERLLCRFDGDGGEVVVEGEVIWRNEEARGGELGLKFTALDTATEEALRALCKQLEEPDEKDEKAPAMPKGARVRLHIEGLASPMKARVRDADDKETLVGSNLEFLKVGRSLELEDVDKGARREAFVDHVKVEVDASSGVPQLVVALRYEAAKAARSDAKAERTANSAAGAAGGAAQAAASVARENSAAKAKAAALAKEREMEKEPEIDADSSLDAEAVSDSPGDVDEESQKHGLAKVGATAASAGRKALGKVGPALNGFGQSAKGAVSKLLDAVKKRREAREEQKKKDAPRRMTAPPPGGALKADGKRLVRDDGEDDESMTPPPAKKNKKAALLGSALGLLAVLAVFGVTRFVAMRNSAPQEPLAATAAPALSALPAAPVDSAPVATANIPLFGATPLSTTEPVPTAAPSASAQADEPAPSADAANEPGGSEDGEEGGGSAEGTKEWGEGNVKSPTKLSVKLDGDVDGFNGAKGAMGFTIVLPGRRVLSSSSELQKKDKRIATFQIANKPNGAELTLQFKDGVPAYLARAKGNKLEIMLGNEGKGKKAIAKAHGKGKSKSGKAAGGGKGKGKKGHH
jgi:hypothetical protein